MLTESFIAATLAVNKPSQQTSSALRDVGIFVHEFQPQVVIRHGFKKSSVQAQCLAISDSHIYTAQADKAVIHVYSREKGTQEATVPFPERIKSLAYADGAAILVLGMESGKLVLWEVATGRLSTSAASHLQAITCLCITRHYEYILSASPDSSVHVWSLPRLVAFSAKAENFSNDIPANAPLRTYSNHRNPVTILTCGHSKSNTNFAVSASDDRTCYIWHIETCQTLRTVLLPSTPLCATVDPVDRAVYLGDESGRIIFLDLFDLFRDSTNPKSSLSSTVPLQIIDKQTWKALSGQVGSAQCLTLSYDGTALLSGHTSGTMIQWDIAKRRVAVELGNLGQPVTNIKMLKLDGLGSKYQAGCVISNVVKPKLEFNTLTDNGTCGIPAKYTFHASLNRSEAPTNVCDDELRALTSSGFPDSMLDDAIQALEYGASVTIGKSGDPAEPLKIVHLEEEILKLKKQLAAVHDVEKRRKAKNMKRMEEREELGLKKRNAYFEAKKKGEDGDAAMKKWEEREAMIDIKSDDEYLGDGMDVS